MHEPARGGSSRARTSENAKPQRLNDDYASILRSGSEGAKSVVLLDGRAFAVNVALAEEQIQKLAMALAFHEKMRRARKADSDWTGMEEKAKKEALELLEAVSVENPELATFFASPDNEQWERGRFYACTHSDLWHPEERDNDSKSEIEDGSPQDKISKQLRLGPKGSRPIVCINDKAFVINAALDEAKIQELAKAIVAHCTLKLQAECGYRVAEKIEAAKRKALKLLSGVAEEDPAWANRIALNWSEEEGDKEYFSVYTDNEILDVDAAIEQHLPNERKSIEETLRSGPEDTKPAIAIGGKCYTINATLDEAMIKELADALMAYYQADGNEAEAEKGKRETIDLLKSKKYSAFGTPCAVPDGEFRAIRVPSELGNLPDLNSAEKKLNEIISGDCSGTILGVIVDHDFYFMCEEPNEKNNKKLVQAMMKFLANEDANSLTIKSLKKSVLDMLVPIDVRDVKTDKTVGVHLYTSRSNGDHMGVFRCEMKKGKSNGAGFKAKSKVAKRGKVAKRKDKSNKEYEEDRDELCCCALL